MDKPKFYLSPISGRVIRSTGKTYSKLREDGYILERYNCRYNTKSVKACFQKLGKGVYPPSDFTKIPKTYKTQGPARAFVYASDNDTSELKGFVDKHGKTFRLKDPITTKRKVPRVSDPTGTLPFVLSRSPIATDEQTASITEQIKRGDTISTPEDMSIIYNPVNSHFVPRKRILSNQDDNKQSETDESIIRTINNELVPLSLPPIKPDGDVAGIIEKQDKDNVNRIVGIVTSKNKIRKFKKSIDAKRKGISTQGLPTLQLTPDIIKMLDKANKEDKTEGLDMESIQIKKSEEVKVLDSIKCTEGEQYDTHENRCMPCSYYNLVWDPRYNRCRIQLREAIIVDTSDNIIGHTTLI